ncbi:MotA/TolQ/ExbB proton channel family protein [Seohaeicola saemankumensis]|nr:MotA/TolQ/ExbB proton channel family protein [Seohaeicola saemankumensis]MCA0870060.1 MotA/TolQ/ExbB proton channel family protein [Seohaeicola saemankumensis]
MAWTLAEMGGRARMLGLLTALVAWSFAGPFAGPVAAQGSAPVLTAPDAAVAPQAQGSAAAPEAGETPVAPVATDAPAAPEIGADPDSASDGDVALTEIAQTAPAEPVSMLGGASARAQKFLLDGGPSIWAIAALSVITVALILWKTWRFFLSGAWSRAMSRRAIDLWEAGDSAGALALVEARRGLRSRMTAAAMRARLTLEDSAAREETTRVAKRLLAGQGGGLRALELIATIAPLLGLLGTVLGMIAAFQALQAAGSRADPALLAGGIWEALLTTAAGMAVAIPASAALTWFEAVIDNIRTDMEDLAARVFIAPLVPTDAQARLAAQ